MSPRLASGVWVSAYLTRLRLANIPAYVTAKGDAEAGAVVVKVALMDGTARAYERRSGPMTGARAGLSFGIPSGERRSSSRSRAAFQKGVKTRK